MADLGAWIGMDRAARQQGVDLEVGVGETGPDLVAWHGEETLGEVERDRIYRDAREVINNRKQRIFTEDEKEQARHLPGSART